MLLTHGKFSLRGHWKTKLCSEQNFPDFRNKMSHSLHLQLCPDQRRVVGNSLLRLEVLVHLLRRFRETFSDASLGFHDPWTERGSDCTWSSSYRNEPAWCDTLICTCHSKPFRMPEKSVIFLSTELLVSSIVFCVWKCFRRVTVITSMP